MNLMLDDSLTVNLKGGDVTVSFKVPNAIETEKMILEKANDTAVFKNFVTKIESKDYENLNEAFPSEVVNLPGTYPLIREVASAIIKAAMFTPEEKN